MVFNATFNIISVISWQSVLLVEETEENHDLLQVTDNFITFELTTLVVIDTDSADIFKFNYHTITTTMVKWSRALDVRLSEWCCSVSMVWVQIPSREEQKFDSSKI
jgi:hypothetical protein